jgi:hypothetical protein
MRTPIDGDLTAISNPVLAGNDTAPHTIKGRVLMRVDTNDTKIRITKKSKVKHAGRHHDISLEPGDYVVTILRERNNKQDRKVVD